MKNALEQFKENAQNIHLREDEKIVMRTFLEKHIEAHPVREMGGDRLQKVKKALWSYQFLPLFIRQSTMPIILVMLLVGGGVSFAAQGSLPGDALYGMKVNFNERVESALSMSSEAKANLEVRLAERRLSEAEELKSGGRLDAETEASLESRFKAHALRVEERIEILSRSEVLVALDVASRFEASLNAHERVLARADTRESANMAMMADSAPVTMQFKATSFAEDSRAGVTLEDANVGQSVRIQAERIAGIRMSLEVKASGEASSSNENAASGKMKAAEKKLVEVAAFIESKIEIDGYLKAEAESELALAEKTFAEGKVKFEAESYNEAFILFQKSLRLAQEAKNRVDVEVRVSEDLILVDPMPTQSEVEVEFSTETSSGVESKSKTRVEIKGGVEIGL